MPRADTTNAVCNYDLTIKANTDDADSWKAQKDSIELFFDQYCKYWAFQLEKSESGYLHFQCRMSLKTKKRLNGMIKLAHGEEYMSSAHITPTKTETTFKKDMIYVMKKETRVEGPWTDVAFSMRSQMPDKYKNDFPVWYPWQLKLIEIIEAPDLDGRTINVITDTTGNIGKTFLTMWLMVRGRAARIALQKDSRDILRQACGMMSPSGSGKLERYIGCFFVDIPKSAPQATKNTMYAALEELKNGYAFDDRYKWKQITFNSPHVWVFTNTRPDLSAVSADRWKFWSVQDGHLTEEGATNPDEDYPEAGTLNWSLMGEDIPVTPPKKKLTIRMSKN